MPSASDDDRLRATTLWGSIDCTGPEEYLEKKGWTLNRGFTWNRPHPTYEPSEEELFAVGFLVDEWDYGPIVS